MDWTMDWTMDCMDYGLDYGLERSKQLYAGSIYVTKAIEGLSPALSQVASEPVAGIVSSISERSKVTRNFNRTQLYSCMT